MIEEKGLHDKVDFKATFCMRQCSCSGVAVAVNGQVYSVMPDTAREFFSTTVIPLLA